MRTRALISTRCLLRLHAGGEVVLHRHHLGHEIGRSISSGLACGGNDDVLILAARFQRVDDSLMSR